MQIENELIEGSIIKQFIIKKLCAKEGKSVVLLKRSLHKNGSWLCSRRVNVNSGLVKTFIFKSGIKKELQGD